MSNTAQDKAGTVTDTEHAGWLGWYRGWWVVLAAAGLWLPGVWGSRFVSDDFSLVQTWGQAPVWGWFATESVGYYRPLSAALFRLDYLLWGQDAFGYYLTNLLLHAGCALGVGHLTAVLGARQRHTGMWAGLLFLFLPGHIFGVLWVSARTGLLCALCYLAAVALFLRARQGGGWCEALSLVAFVAALLAKELAVSLPLLIALWYAVLCRPTAGRLLRVVLPYVLVLAGYLGWRYLQFGHLPESVLHTNTDPTRLVLNAAIYTAKLFVPWGLEGLKPLFRAYPLGLWAAVMVGAALAAGLAWQSRHRLGAAHLLGGAWVLITLLPVLRLYSPWSTYLSAVGAAMLMALLLDRVEKRRIRQGVLGVLVGVSAIYALTQQRHWQQAGVLAARVAAEVASTAAAGSGKIYLANLPVEWGEAPVFGGDWGLDAALRLLGQRVEVESVVGVCKDGPGEDLEAWPLDEQRFALKLRSPGDFFRLETAEVLSKQVRPMPGYSYNKGAARITVRGLNQQNEAKELEVDMGTPERLKQVRIWDGEHLVPVVR